MTDPAYESLAERLTPEARELFRQMVDAHLAAGRGDRRFVDSGGVLIFNGPPHLNLEDIDPGALADLVDHHLLRLTHTNCGTANYFVTGDGVHFHGWLMEREGAAVAQVDDQVRSTLDGEAFANAHPGAAHHLREAFELVWTGRHDEPTVSEIGDHLRKALMDATSDVVGPDPGKQEKPAKRLRDRLTTVSDDLGERESVVLERLVELAAAVLQLDQRLNT